MKTNVERLNETKVKLTINLGKEELDAGEQVALKKLSKDIKVAGFRKGHVPLEVVAKNVDPNALAQETVENAISKAVAEAFMSNDLQALERPEVKVKKFVPGGELEFTATADVLPEVKLGDYKKLKAKKEKVSVSKEEVDEVVGRIKAQFATKESVKRAAKEGDEVNIDFLGKKDDVPFEGGKAEGYDLVLGSNSFIPGFEEAIVGRKPGESFDIPLTFPKDYHSEDLKGKKVVFEVKLNDIKEVKQPELTDELAAKTGPFTSADELLDDIKKELTAQKEREQNDKLKDELVKQLVEKSQVSVPEILKQDQIQSIEQDMMQNLMYQGMTTEQYYQSKGYKTREDWLAGEVSEAAENRVKAGLVLAELSKVEKVEATSDELAERLNMMRQQYSKNPEMAKRLEEPEVQRDVANRMLTEKTVELLVDLNTK